jgi:hypothetical protein
MTTASSFVRTTRRLCRGERPCADRETRSKNARTVTPLHRRELACLVHASPRARGADWETSPVARAEPARYATNSAYSAERRIAWRRSRRFHRQQLPQAVSPTMPPPVPCRESSRDRAFAAEAQARTVTLRSAMVMLALPPMAIHGPTMLLRSEALSNTATECLSP